MGETTQGERLGWRDVAERRVEQTDEQFVTLLAGDLLRFVNDADRLATIERQLHRAIDGLHTAATTAYEQGDAVRQAECNSIADQLRAILAAAPQPEQEGNEGG